MPYRRCIWLLSLRNWLLLICLSIGIAAQAQVKTTRILFVLDASGSMAGKWDGVEKFDLAKRLLFEAIDSLEHSPTNIEFGLRMFGHQSHRTANDCEDAKLEVPFGPNNAQRIFDKLANTTNQGQTPIAYSLFQAVQDFPQDPFGKNVIILITDGIETCDGDPCAVAPILQQNNIAVRPFIIGLGLGQEGATFFDCVGTYYDADNETAFEEALNVVISQAVNSTTAQINLLDKQGKPTETNIEVTLYDNYNKGLEQVYVHALGYYGRIDSLQLTPVIDYDMVVHTVPPTKVEGLSLAPGKHNIMPADVPQGTLILKIDGYSRLAEGQCVIRKAGDAEILDVQQLNTKKRLLTGKYDLEILTLPPIYVNDVLIQANEEEVILVPEEGNFNLFVSRPGITSIYQIEQGQMKKIFETPYFEEQLSLELLPGEYQVVYRQHQYKSAKLTQSKTFSIYARGTTNVTF